MNSKFVDSGDFITVTAPPDLPEQEQGTVRKMTVVDGSTVYEDYDVLTPPRGLSKAELKQWIEKQIEGESLPQVIVRDEEAAEDLHWPIRFMEIHDSPDGYVVRISTQRIPNAVKVRVHPSMVGKITQAEADRLAEFAPVYRAERLRAVERFGSCVKFVSKDGKQKEWRFV